MEMKNMNLCTFYKLIRNNFEKNISKSNFCIKCPLGKVSVINCWNSKNRISNKKISD